MARLSSVIQQDEVRAYEKFCIEHNILLGGGNDDVASIANANLVRDYFTKTWNEVITEETLTRALPQLRPHLKFKSTARLEFEKVSAAEPDRASQLDAWLQAQGGRPGQLVNSLFSDDTYENLTLLLGMLRGYEISTPRVRDAEDRLANRPGRKLHYVEVPRRTESRSAITRGDDSNSTNWLGRDMIKNLDGSYRNKDYAEEKADREAAERAKSQSQTTQLSETDQAWRRMATELLGDGTHGQQARVRAVYDAEQGNGWRRVYEACKKEASLYRSRSIR